LYLITELSTDEGFLKKDTISYTMANPDGTWVGNASGSLVEHKIPLHLQKTFRSTKPHKLTIRQAMRALGSVQPLQKLNGISDIGYSIETSEK
jgi:gliding motility-associated lipoprotein GldH